MSKLSDSQIEAMNNFEGPLLVLAGAGTGKTTMLTGRIANLIKSNTAQSHEILAVTFTNKAAKEMRERLQKLENNTIGIFLGTFHGISAKFLRIYHEALDLDKNFVIIDDADRKRILKKISESLSIDEKRFPIKLLSFIISGLKENYVQKNDLDALSNYKYKDLDIIKLYQEYQYQLKIINAVDFDDLIFESINLFKNHPKILNDIQNRFKFILVDEYQDTNKLQHIWLNLLASKYKNICCVGDEDQSIYEWRGAEVKHILNFPKEFPGTKIIKLEENYRSTKAIIKAANQLIKNNSKRYDKNLFSSKNEGEMPKIYILEDDRKEANQIIKDIKDLNKTIKYQDMAILVRATYQTRLIEEYLLINKIPYQVVDGLKFYDRKEIKDLIYYLRFINSNKDFLAFERIINVPKRGIGDVTINKIFEISKNHNFNIIAGIQNIMEEKIFSIKILNELKEFYDKILSWQELFNKNESLFDIMTQIYQESGYSQMLVNLADEDSNESYRIDNVREFLESLKKFQSIEEFLEHIALMNSADDAINLDSVNILTMHGSKGLEFNAILLPGWDEDIFPSKKSIEENNNGIEEERRLAYVAITRAKERVIIYSSKMRYVFGKMQISTPSRFINEMKNFVDIIDEKILKNKILYNYSNKIVNNNGKVDHSKFGNGTIIKKIGKFLEIKFDDGITRVIQEDYIK